MDVLIIYQFCTFGGVERAILNRAQAFKKYKQDVHLSIGYLINFNALDSFQAYIRAHNLDDILSAFLIDEDVWRDLDRYDIVLNIDTPQIFERTLHARNLLIECHTPYIENRQYLKSLPKNAKGIIVPSQAFKTLITSEFQDLPPIYILTNPVSDEFYNIPLVPDDRVYDRHPLAYLARLDDLKNFTETQRIFNLFIDDDQFMFAVVGHGAEDPNLVHDLINNGMLGKTFCGNQIDFDAVPAFIQMIKNHKGVFISSSKGESFGLSAAEFISAGVPVLLSDITPHQELVEGNEKFIYPLGDIYTARNKILEIMKQWDDASKMMEVYAQKFNGASFISAWQEISSALWDIAW